VTGRKSKGKPKTGLEDAAMGFRIEFGERMRHLLDMFGSRPEAAKVAGVTPEHLASYINGSAKPPFALVARLAKAQGVSLEWMSSGEGRTSLNDAADGFAVVPVHERDSSSGPGSYAMAEEVRNYLAFSRAWLQAVIRVPEERLCVVFNRGTDNLPDIRDGEAMLVVTGLGRVADDGWHIFNIDGRLMTMNVRHALNGRVGLFTRRTENTPEYFTAEEAAAKVFGRVRWRCGIV
jgi:helix-turn-helix protein